VKSLIAGTIALFAYHLSRVDIDRIVGIFRGVLASALNERLLASSIARVERKLSADVPPGSVSSEKTCGDIATLCASGYGTALEICVSKLVYILQSVEESEYGARWVEKDKLHLGELSNKASLYGTGSFLTFEDEREAIFQLIGLGDAEMSKK
jgi:hypothetical protein